MRNDDHPRLNVGSALKTTRRPGCGRVRIETPSARAEASAQLRSRSDCSRRHAARDTRSSTRRSRRQAAIGSVIVTLTPCPCQRCSANWTA